MFVDFIPVDEAHVTHCAIFRKHVIVLFNHSLFFLSCFFSIQQIKCNASLRINWNLSNVAWLLRNSSILIDFMVKYSMIKFSKFILFELIFDAIPKVFFFAQSFWIVNDFNEFCIKDMFEMIKPGKKGK